MPLNKIEKERFIKFAFVGFSGTIVDFGIFNILIYIQFSSIIASTISFIVAVFNNFYWNRNWTYPESKIHPISSQLIKFGVVSIAGLVIRTILYKLIEQPIINFAEGFLIENFIFSAKVVGKNITLSFVIITVLFWNFFANRLWTYKYI